MFQDKTIVYQPANLDGLAIMEYVGRFLAIVVQDRFAVLVFAIPKDTAGQTLIAQVQLFAVAIDV